MEIFFKRITLLIKYLIFSFIGIISFFIRKILYLFKNKSKSKYSKIAVIGRGNSANKFFKSDYINHNLIFIANYTTEDLYFKDYFKLLKKDIYLISNIQELIPNYFLLFLWNINQVIIPRPQALLNIWGRDIERYSFRLNSLGCSVRGITNAKVKKGFPCNLGNTGLISVYEALEFSKLNNINEIYLYGFDLYSNILNKKTYLRKDYNSEKQYQEHLNISKSLSQRLDKLSSLYPNVKIIYPTLNPYKFKSKNIKKLNY